MGVRRARSRRRRRAQPVGRVDHGDVGRSARARVVCCRPRGDRRRPWPRRDPRRHRRQAGDSSPRRARLGSVPRSRAPSRQRGRRGAATRRSPIAIGRCAKPPRTSFPASDSSPSWAVGKRTPRYTGGATDGREDFVAVEERALPLAPPLHRARVERRSLSTRNIKVCSGRRWCRGRRNRGVTYSRLAASRVGARREVDLGGATTAGFVEGGQIERFADASAPCTGVDDDVVDPRLDARRQRVHRQREAADDLAVDARHEQRAVGIVDNRRQPLTTRCRGRTRELWDQPFEGVDEIVTDVRDNLDLGAHSAARLMPGVG